jgi:hypothetical protein
VEGAFANGDNLTAGRRTAQGRCIPALRGHEGWHEGTSIPIENFLISDALHMSDWDDACFAQLLGDDIISSVGQIKLSVHVPADARAYRPM